MIEPSLSSDVKSMLADELWCAIETLHLIDVQRLEQITGLEERVAYLEKVQVVDMPFVLERVTALEENLKGLADFLIKGCKNHNMRLHAIEDYMVIDMIEDIPEPVPWEELD